MSGFRSQHFGLKHRLVAMVSSRVFGNYTYTIHHGLAAGMRRKGGLGFVPFDSPDTAETKFLREFPFEGKVVYDIGAFEGVLTLYFARRAKRVVSFEPNPRNYERCITNVRLNDLTNVEVLNSGIAERAATIKLSYDPLMPGAGSAESTLSDYIQTSVKTAKTIEISVRPLDVEMKERNLPPPDFVKIDVEGMEHHVLMGMQETIAAHRPAFFIEMHGATLKEKSEIAEAVAGFFDSRGYRIHDVENNRDLTVSTMGATRPAHIYCTPA